MNLETRLPLDLWAAVRTNYEKRNFTGAILDAFYYLSDLIRKKSGADGDGAALIGQALGGSSPKIKLNRLQSESELNVQRGYEQLLRGFYQAIRNPRSHDKFSDSEEDAQILLVFIGYIAHQIDQAKSQFSRQDFLKRVLDPDFVPKERYAKLLVDQIPPGQRLEVFLDVYRSKEAGDPKHLRYFFSSLLPELSSDELKQVFEVISEELKTTDDETIIRLNVASFGKDNWPHLDEAARLRIENRLIRSLEEGRYHAKLNHCRGGALATWSTSFFQHFSLKEEMINAIANKLHSESIEQQDYALNYFLGHLSKLTNTMPTRVASAFRMKLRQGNARFHAALVRDCPWPKETWSPSLLIAFNEYKEAEESNTFDDDDIPF